MTTLAIPADFTIHNYRSTSSPVLSAVDILNRQLLGIKISEIKRGTVTVSFTPRRGIKKNTKTCIIPAEIPVDKELAVVVGLYLGDGDKGNRLKFSNCNSEIIQYFLKYLTRLGVRKCDIRVRISLNKNAKNHSQIRQLLKMFGFSDSHISIRRGIRFAKPVIEIKVESTLFAKIWKTILGKTMPVIINNTVLRRAFLQGAFAADGGISWNKCQHKKFLQKVSFSYNTKTEKKFRDILIECLTQENIPMWVKEAGADGRIFIRGYAGFARLYDLEVFDLHKDRLRKFHEAIKLADIFVDLDNEAMEKLFKSETQRKIATLIGSYQQNISKVLQGKRRLRVEWLIKMCLMKGLSPTDVIPHVKGISFKSSKLQNPSPNLLRTILKLKQDIIFKR